jgi:polyhydroxyalkanoate synthase subunit PhaC
MTSQGSSGSLREASAGPAGPIPGLDVMLEFWTSWVESVSKLASSAAQADVAGRPTQMSSDQIMSEWLKGGAQQLGEMLSKDPPLQAVETALNVNPLREVIPVDWAEIARALRTVWLHSIPQPDKALAATAEFNIRAWQTALDIWSEASKRWLGLATEPAPASADKRFAAPEWQNNPVYRTLMELYLLASDWLLGRIATLTDLSESERRRVDFHLRQFIDAMSPTLSIASNPVALRRAIETGGASLADGMRNLLHDVEQGKLSMVDATAFAPGRNLALTPGKVVLRNKLIELIQYAPSTESVHQVPIMLIPPWINKFYIMDMQPKNSLVRFLVSQGFTTFMLSWRNPDSSMEDTTIDEYTDLGPLAASDAIREITGSDKVNVMGYCIGGTLLAITLAWLAAKNDHRFASATFMVSLEDFEKVGDTAVFLGEPTIDFIEQQMMDRGYLDSRQMSNMFNLLRSNDLIWSNVVNNYLLGQKPPTFDLLYWNADGTRMARRAHSWYLRNTYVENNLVKPGKIELKGEKLDLGRVRLDVYAVGAEKDHIVPWRAAWRITQLLKNSHVRFILASSGHIAGMINPPGGKGQYWTNDAELATPEDWLEGAERHDGSWWTDWSHWLAVRAGEKVQPPAVGNLAHKPLQDAPGSYVLEK